MRYCPTCYAAYPDRTSGTCPKDGSILVAPHEYASLRADPLIGTTLAGRYEIRGRIGTGGMGTVYRAEQVGLGRQVALKVLKSELVVERETVARFHREAKAMSLLVHPNTVRVFDFGEDPSGHLFLAMELLEGELLSSRIEGAADGTAPRPLDPEEAITIVREVLRSLSEAHGKGLVHRDLKPDNIYLARVPGHPRPVVKVLDFGIAKVFREDDQKLDQLQTQAGTVFGTPRYMSPEQAQGKALDPRSDLYTVGVLLYQLIVGRCPFVDDDAVVVMAKHIRDEPDAPRVAAPERPIPPSLERATMRALAKDPSARFATAEQFEAALTECLPDVAREKALFDEGRRSATFLESVPGAPRAPVAIALAVLVVALTAGVTVALTGGAGASSTGGVVTVVPPEVPSALPGTPMSGVAPPAPAMRTVVVSTAPAGAELWRAGVRLGTTPFVLDVPVDDPGEPVALRLDGHAEATLDLRAAGPSPLVVLTPTPARRAAGPDRAGGGRRDTAEAPTEPMEPATPPPTAPTTSPYERFD